MPTWQPNWTDVQFDYQAAYETIGNCYGCLAFLESRNHNLASARAQATREWRGRYREEFDTESARLDRFAFDVMSQLRAAVEGVYAEIASAELEQRIRIADRTRWEAEVRAEHAHDEELAAERSRPVQRMGSAPMPGSYGIGVIALS